MINDLLHFLTSEDPYDEFLKYFDNYNNQNDSRLENCTIKLTQKERAFKTEGRMSSQSPYPERFRRCLLEYNISKAMKYNHDQLMIQMETQKL